MNLQRGWEKEPRRNSRLPKKHLFHSRPEALWTTFRLYKNSKSQTLETLVSFKLHLIITLPLSIFFPLFARKANIVYYLSHNCVSIKTIFLLFVKQRVFSLLWVARQSSHSYYLTMRRRSSWIVSTPFRGSFKHSVGMEGFDKANSPKLMW